MKAMAERVCEKVKKKKSMSWKKISRKSWKHARWWNCEQNMSLCFASIFQNFFPSQGKEEIFKSISASCFYDSIDRNREKISRRNVIFPKFYFWEETKTNKLKGWGNFFELFLLILSLIYDDKTESFFRAFSL